MKKKYLTLLLLIAALFSFGQKGMISPGESFRNTFDTNIFYMPESKLDSIIDLHTTNEINKKRIVKLEELVANMKERQVLSDTATQLRKLEAQFWHDKLFANDEQLKEQKIANVKLQADLERVRQSRIYYFLAGIVATSVTIGVLK